MHALRRYARLVAVLIAGGAASCSSASALDSGAYHCEISETLVVGSSGEAQRIVSEVKQFALYAYGEGEAVGIVREAPGPSLQVHGEEMPAVAVRLGGALFDTPSNLMTSEDARVFIQSGAVISFTREERFVATGPSPKQHGDGLIVHIGACERQR
jgi:hypothetical protein